MQMYLVLDLINDFVEGHDRDYGMVVLEDCCSAMSAEEHDAAIELLQGFCTITTFRDVTFA